MAHEVLYKAGCLRDESLDGVVNQEEYKSIIPSELLYPELQQIFQIHSWHRYFVPIIKRTAEYEEEVCEYFTENEEPYHIERKIKFQMTVDELAEMGYKGFEQPFVGIIDFLAVGDSRAVILDYKFSSSKKTQDDFDMNNQLYMYAFFVHTKYDIPLHNIKVGYIDIPKQMFDQPTVLSNGTLSRSKMQNVLPELYKAAVEAIHGDDERYNCEPGGWYYDCYMALQLNDVAYLSLQYLDEEAYYYIVDDVFKCGILIDKMIREKTMFPRKHSAYECKSCEYINSCKPWLTVNGGEI
jgi:CRISPR/Cas system-associated exonuclease Cas4 (RecB family)